MKKVFAVTEIIFSVVMFVSAIIFYCRTINIVSGSRISRFADAAKNYKEIIKSSKEIFEKTYSTIPQHKKTLLSACSEIDNLRKECKHLSNVLPHQIDDWPMMIYKPVGETKKSLLQMIEVLNSFDETKHEQIITAFDQTSRSLSDAENSFRTAAVQFSASSIFLLIFALSASICFFANGFITYSDLRKTKQKQINTEI